MNTQHVTQLLQDVPNRALRSATERCLAEYGLRVLEDWLFQLSEDMNRPLSDGSDWATLEAQARRKDPKARWFRRFLVEPFDAKVYKQGEGYCLETIPLLLGFETMPTLDELRDAIANARHQMDADAEAWLLYDADAGRMAPELFFVPVEAPEPARLAECVPMALPLLRIPVAAC